VLHCGDITEDGSPPSIAEAIQALANIKAELRLVIAGNHQISLDKSYYLGEGGKSEDYERAHEVTSGASKSGVTFLNEGTYTFTLSSGDTFRIYASPYTPAYGASGFQYPTNEDRYNPHHITPAWSRNVASYATIIPDDVDIAMTHGPPKYILDATYDGCSAGCEHLRRAVGRVKPKLHCFGHIHGAHGAQRLQFKEKAISKEDSDLIVPLNKEFIGENQSKKRGYASLPLGSLEAFRTKKQTLCINTAMEGKDGGLENAPWVVDLNLSRVV
jgi:hypothetical protein